ncbi:MAG TPA: malto-oligosyltrehalose synthase [Candidatus Sulfotelmatobacter sp.]|nr:malto-oligosyltrehalose synthase [Candidatus Sulfotelmatobacter sp.]
MRTNPAILTTESSGISECLDRLASEKRSARPLSTYRLQFNAGFRFENARRLIGYLHALGVSHVYSSPILKARAGSIHGYDITDHNQLNPEIGSYEELKDLVRELKNYGMGQVLDFVPNHMGIGPGTNPWWKDVLANGRTSDFADFFDLDWDPLKPELHNKLLLPVLGDQYGAELEAGHIKLVSDEEGFHIEYYDARLPIDPQTIPIIFEPLGQEAPQELRSLLAGMRNLAMHSATDGEAVRQRRRTIPSLLQAWKELLAKSPEMEQTIERAVVLMNGRAEDPRSFDPLHRLLEAQVYRLAHWRVSGEEINYRRFFDVNDLIGLRMENPRVFGATHQLLRHLLADDMIQGLRLDHCDGLLNPRQYMIRLQMLYAASQCAGATPRPPLAENGIEVEIQQVFGQHDWMNRRAPLYTVVEKILEPGEEIPVEWPVDGTSGYDFTTLVNGVFIERRNERAFTNLYHRFTGTAYDVDTLIYNSKKLIMHASLASEVNVLAHLLDTISLTDRYARDYTRKTLRDVIRETIACFPVYRTYIDERGQMTDRDRAYIHEAITRAKRRNPDKAPASFDFLRDILRLGRKDSEDQNDLYRKKLYFTLKFQQLTGPVMAKGLEDTACYVYNRFVAVNEVGGSPKQFGVSVDEFHSGNIKRAEHWPFSMLATSTHDTKRSEDARARLDVLSEMPKVWSAQVFRWRKANRTRKRLLTDGRHVPDLNEEYLLYQTLAGSWPFNFSAERESYIERIKQYMAKAVHEAKVNLSWINDDPGYVEALQQFITKVLLPGTRSRVNSFLEQVQAFLPPVIFFGAINSLAQRLLMITSPGNPDIYQGTELWDFSLVDPDNRRPVDYDLRQRLLTELDRRAESGNLPELCRELINNFQDGRIKMWTTMQALRVRRDRRDLFHLGGYRPLGAIGSRQQHVVSFAREHNRHVAIIAVPRLSYTLAGGALHAPLGSLWESTEIPVPPRTTEFLENVFTGEKVRVSGNRTLLCHELFANFPVALLVSG